jgi:predicted transcriptional regulator
MAAQEARIRAAHAVALQRANPTWSLTRAAREAHTTSATVRRHLPGALAQDERGRWRATTSDREAFTMRMVSVEDGVTAVNVAGSRKRSLLGAHHAAIRAYLLRGDRAGLDALAGSSVAGRHLQTDPKIIRELYRQGELSFLEIYTLTH